MMSRLASTIVATVLLWQSCLAAKSVLVLVPDAKAADSYSQFLDSLRGAGFTLDVKGVRDPSLKLREYGVWAYDNLALLAPKAESFGGSLDAQTILDFVDSGHSVLLAASSDVSEAMRGLAAEFGVDLDDKGTKVFDHFRHGSVNGVEDHTLVSSSDLVGLPVMTGGPYTAPVLFRGVAAAVPADSELVTVVLSAAATSYSHDPRKAMVEPPSLMVGNGAALVTAVQARNNARALVVGSVDMFSDAVYSATSGGSEPANKAFCLAVARWTFQDAGVLVTSNLRQHIIGSDVQPTLYRVNDEVEFLIDVQERNGDSLTPYTGDDIQLEFTMLYPYVRQPLVHNGAGTFSLRFKVPDVYGVFKYVIDYSHRGYSFIKLTHQIPVRPFKHNEYERFLVCAYPYYASAISMMAGFFALGFFYLYSK